MDRIQNLFLPRRLSDKKKLMSLPRAVTSDQAEKAIDHLLKKLKHKPRAVEELQRAVTNPDLETNCVTIQRSMDGRLQIDRRKGLPHVVYCRLWRWADLENHTQLQALGCCKHPFSATGDPEVCVNPYHYERVQARNFAVSVPKKAAHTVCCESCNENPSKSMPQNVTLDPIASFPIEQPYQNKGTMYYQNGCVVTMSPNDCDCKQQVFKQNDTNWVQYSQECDWAKLAYFELNKRVGEEFHCSHSQVMVDGYTSPHKDQGRFCLGGLSNFDRSPTSEKVRMYIGKGLVLTHLPESGQVVLNCQSEHAVFVQSAVFNNQMGYVSGTVVKVLPNHIMKIFDLDHFCKVLEHSIGRGFKTVYELNKMCTIRLSFVKGWGVDYQRQDVTATPCWLEIRLTSPLKWLDNVLLQMPSPADYLSSVT